MCDNPEVILEHGFKWTKNFRIKWLEEVKY